MRNMHLIWKQRNTICRRTDAGKTSKHGRDIASFEILVFEFVRTRAGYGKIWSGYVDFEIADQRITAVRGE